MTTVKFVLVEPTSTFLYKSPRLILPEHIYSKVSDPKHSCPAHYGTRPLPASTTGSTVANDFWGRARSVEFIPVSEN